LIAAKYSLTRSARSFGPRTRTRTRPYVLRLRVVFSPRRSSNSAPRTVEQSDLQQSQSTSRSAKFGNETGGANTDHSTSDPASHRGSLERAWPWIVRGVWFLTAVLCTPLLSEALSLRSRPVQLLLAIAAWVIWGGGLVATLVPHPLGLVGLRIAAPLLLASSSWATAQPNTSSAARVLGLVCALITTFIVLVHETGHLCVNGPAYPNERRFLLRPPASLLIIAPIAAALVAAGVLAGPLMLAAKQWVFGCLISVLGFGLAFILTRSLFALARRFLVFVPAGFVIHDYSALREPVLFKRGQIERLRAAPPDTDSLDLTMGAPGLVLEVLLKEKVEMARLASPRDRVGETGKSARFLAVPTLPGRLLNEARSRKYPVG
jgi:hypothetical protein